MIYWSEKFSLNSRKAFICPSGTTHGSPELLGASVEHFSLWVLGQKEVGDGLVGAKDKDMGGEEWRARLLALIHLAHGGTHGTVELKDIGCLVLDGLTEEVAEHSFLVWLRANHVPVEVGAVLLVACHHPTPGIPCRSGGAVVWRRNECHGSHE